MPDKLIRGFQKFKADYFGEDLRLFQRLTDKGQAPETLIIACSDSRNDPALITRSAPGDIFVIRNVAALVPPYQPDDHYHGTSAAIEFAVKGLKVRDIVVLGHALCGGAQALATHGMDQPEKFEFISQWISLGKKARDAVEENLTSSSPEDRQRALEQALILTSLNNLMTFPWIRSRVEEGSCALHGWYFDMVNGELLGYDPVKETFLPLRDPSKKSQAAE